MKKIRLLILLCSFISITQAQENLAINENKSSYYPEIKTCKQGVCSPYNELGTR
jgi:hypothetical protein